MTSGPAVGKPYRTPPAYAVVSVDHALRIATMLQLEGPLTVSDVARRLGVARSTAHRLLAMLVYRDFAVQDDERAYRAGPVLQLAPPSPARTSRLRSAALPHMRRLVNVVDESVNLTIRTGAGARFVASVECAQALRVGSREGMVFPAHETTAGMLLLAELSREELAVLYSAEPIARPDLRRLDEELAHVRRAGFAVNAGRSERGVVAIGVPVRHCDRAVAGLSVSMPSVRYEKCRLAVVVSLLHSAARRTERDLGAYDASASVPLRGGGGRGGGGGAWS